MYQDDSESQTIAEKTCEMVQSWHTDLVKCEKLDNVIACKHKKYVKLTKSSR